MSDATVPGAGPDGGPRPIEGTMRAAVWSGGSPSLAVRRIPIPAPRADEALVRVRACGVCHSDLHVMKGEVAFPAPAVMGHEISGTVVAFGPGTDDTRGLTVGDAVVGAFIMPCGRCAACAAGRDDMCVEFFAKNRLKGQLYDGTSRLADADGSPLAMYSMAGLAEYSVVPVTALARLEEGLPPAESAVLGCAAFTAYGALHRAAELRPGETVAVVAVGGVGLSMIHAARALGAGLVIAVDVSDEKLDAARAAGADAVVNSRETDPVAAVRELTEGRGVDVACEALGLPLTFRQCTQMLAEGGRMVAVGIAAGAAAAEIDITPLVRRGQRIIGSFGARTRTDLAEVVRLASAGAFGVEQIVTRRFSLDDADEAYAELARGAITGRAIVVMDEDG